ncbi:phytoene desaturase family protein [Aliifodinibius sp. S!AR15-10]|uniref:phytoene desaturase family protein n=1 Tax=Aliifodinibius sp. S!AR15-10 TaxID=2950437 RepID=UPI00285A70DB|nr:phytoene desaturase family protein [Aliifodinibius sp. S!AR15-10]MDR8392587.1 phytoene desaturase family protein [Aliifodinibius sp. S!AR15-10]
MKIAVIGAGIGGLAVASLLANDGHEVIVYEKNDTVGGKMNEIQAESFRFDTGPSLLTMPELLEELFTCCGENLDSYLELKPLKPLCRYFYKDGTIFDNFQDLDRSLEEVQRIAPEDRTAYKEFLSYTRELYEKVSTPFLFNPLFNFTDVKNLNFADLLDIDALSTVSKRIDSYFKSPYLRQFFKRFATYNGSSPYQAPATLNVIPHVEINRGGYYVKGGIYRIAEALTNLAERKGAEIRLNSTAKAIKMEHEVVTGIVLADGTKISCDLVVSNSDAYETYLHLLPHRDVPPLKKELISQTEPSCSGFVLLLGVDRKYEQLQHHNVFFSGDYEQEFRTIFEEKLPAEDPTIYIANTSASDPEHAVKGGANLFVLVNAPYLSDNVDWRNEKTGYAGLIKHKLQNYGLEGLQDAILYEKVITPLDFYKQYRSNRGSIYGTSSNSRLATFMRPGNKARSVEGLYLVGGSTHPGGGIPLVLLSARHAYTLVKRYNT